MSFIYINFINNQPSYQLHIRTNKKNFNFQFKDIDTINKILSQTLNSTKQENNMQLVTLFKTLKHER